MVFSGGNDQIPVMTSVGYGGTALSAFHSALAAINLDGYNLIRLSSVVPPHTGVDRTGSAPAPSGVWGDRLYCVYAELRATVAGEQAWAGLGWVQRLDGRGGLFVEHTGRTEQDVARALRTSLLDLVTGRRDEFTSPDWMISGAACTDRPVCALVIAPYQTEPWGARCG